MEYLLAVVEEESFTRAAQRLRVSQPALSHQVRALERTVGQPLLERLPATVRLTPMGRAYLPHAAAALRSAEAARRAGRPTGPAELRVATLFSLTLGILPPAIGAWRRLHPETDIELRELPNDEELAEYMALGVADVAVGSAPRDWEGPVRVIGTEELVVVLAPGDPLAATGDGRVALAALADRPWVLFAPENALARVVEKACAKAGFRPRAAVRTRHTATAVHLAAAGLGPALVPDAIVPSDLDCERLTPDPPVRRDLAAFAPLGAAPVVASFVDVLAEHGARRAR